MFRIRLHWFGKLSEDVEVRANTIELLKETLKLKMDKCMISTGSMADPYTLVLKENRGSTQCIQLRQNNGIKFNPNGELFGFADDIRDIQ